MPLDRVTITGADCATSPSELMALSEQYPFVEWGILASKSRGGCPRYPSWEWMTRPEFEAMGNLSLHVCGHWMREILRGDNLIAELMAISKRIQFNFKPHMVPEDVSGFCRILKGMAKQFIFQVDHDGNDVLQSVSEQEENIDAFGLFDASGGTGKLPDSWPEPYFMTTDSAYAYCGYAGGLSPDNLAEQLPLIDAASKGARYWIDMESGVRTDDMLDMGKVRRVLEICKDFMATGFY